MQSLNKVMMRSFNQQLHELLADNLNRYVMLVSCELPEGSGDKSYRLELFA